MTQKVAGSNFGRSALGSNLGQVVLSHVPLSPSSIIWYRSRGGDAVRLGRQPYSWRRTGHASQTSLVYPPTCTGSRPQKWRWAPCLHSSWGMALLYLYVRYQYPWRSGKTHPRIDRLCIELDFNYVSKSVVKSVFKKHCQCSTIQVIVSATRTYNLIVRCCRMSCSVEGWVDERPDVRNADHGGNPGCQVGGPFHHARSLPSADCVQVHSVPRLGTRRRRRPSQTVTVTQFIYFI